MNTISHKDNSYSRVNSMWHCGEGHENCCFGPTGNGRCSRENQPCTPRSSVKRKKRVFTIFISCLLVGIFALLLTYSKVFQIFSPGSLSISHTEVENCENCHQAASESMASWIHRAVNLASFNDDKKCLTCHNLGENAFNPHTIQLSVLETSTKQKEVTDQSHWKMKIASRLVSNENNNISCSNCHREHKGKFVSLKAFETDKCHTCHAVKFDRIEQSHPTYTEYPYTQRTSINFDHVSHLEKYFLEDEFIDTAPLGCKQCHDTDQTGEWMLTRSFENNCSSCHLDEILGQGRATTKGLAVLSIPELDIDTLSKAGFHVGEWPRWADGELTPIFKLLLQTNNERLNAVINNKDLELFDLNGLNNDQLKSVAELAWLIKTFFYDVSVGGTNKLKQQLIKTLKHASDSSEISQLIASLPHDTILNNQREWFPNLLIEVPEFLNGKVSTSTPPAVKDNQSTTTDPNNNENEGVIYIKTQNGEDLIDDGESLNSELLGDLDNLIIDDDLAKKLDDGFSDDLTDELSDNFLDEEIDELSVALTDELNDDLEDNVVDDESTTKESQPIVQEISSEDWAASGGWYRDGSNILYRPGQHADQFFKTWLDISVAKHNNLEVGIFNSLNSDQAVGGCMNCHTVSKDENLKLINWYSFKPERLVKDFNQFLHVSHFSLMTDDGCSSCHFLDVGVQAETVNSVDNDFMFTSGFASMENNTCTQCHQQGRAPADCLTCHQYHVGKVMNTIEDISDDMGTREQDATQN